MILCKTMIAFLLTPITLRVMSENRLDFLRTSLMRERRQTVRSFPELEYDLFEDLERDRM